jgi:putative hemolysin
MKKWVVFTIMALILAACASYPTAAPMSEEPVNTGGQQLPNPAAVYCEQQGYTSIIRTAEDGSQAGVCAFPDGSECDEWAYYRGECQPAGEVTQEPAAAEAAEDEKSTEIPTALPVDPALYEGWVTYVHPVYGFSLMVPGDWVVEDASSGDSILNGHILTIKPGAAITPEHIRMTFKENGDSLLLWPTGVGQGEFVNDGTLSIGDQVIQRILLMCPTGEVTSIYYHPSSEQPNIAIGSMEFAFIYNASTSHCEAGYSLSGKLQNLGELIIASLKVP